MRRSDMLDRLVDAALPARRHPPLDLPEPASQPNRLYS
jgi:hypothetical protein